MRMRRRLLVPGLALVLLVGCSSSETVPEDDATAGASADGTTEDQSDGGLESSVTTSRSTVTSDVEVRVAEIISDYDGVTTEAGTTLTVPAEVLFDFDESELRPDAEARLDEILEVLGFYEDAPVEVVGHTDDRGEDAYNQTLSEDRAAAVAAYLEQGGVDPGRLTVEGRGETDPARPNDSDTGRQANRRVEITVVGVAPPEVE
jgi:outer membrane protein OmpA-like peptidoglycan-associated protein